MHLASAEKHCLLVAQLYFLRMLRVFRTAQSFLLAALALASSAALSRADDWPQWMGPQRDGVWRETGIIDSIPLSGPKILWRVPISPGYAGPAVAGGHIFLMDRIAHALPPSGRNAKPPRPQTAGVERVLCLNESDGSLIWKDDYFADYPIAYNAGPRATPLIHQGKLYTLGAQGDVRCYASDSGKLIWSARLCDDPAKTPTWGYSASALIDGQKLVCLGSADNIVIAY